MKSAVKNIRLPLWLATLIAVVLTLAQHQVLADQEPHAVIEAVTKKVLDDIGSYREALREASDNSENDARMTEFFGKLQDTLEPVVDFRWIALNVMGNHRQKATPEQQERFREVFTQALVETYGRGLLSYSGQQIVVVPPSEPAADQRRVTVRQEIHSDDGRIPLLYSMGASRSGDWKVVNVIINGINLGTTFRNQFAQAYNRYGGDIDRVVDNWAVQNPDN